MSNREVRPQTQTCCSKQCMHSSDTEDHKTSDRVDHDHVSKPLRLRPSLSHPSLLTTFTTRPVKYSMRCADLNALKVARLPKTSTSRLRKPGGWQERIVARSRKWTNRQEVRNETVQELQLRPRTSTRCSQKPRASHAKVSTQSRALRNPNTRVRHSHYSISLPSFA